MKNLVFGMMLFAGLFLMYSCVEETKNMSEILETADFDPSKSSQERMGNAPSEIFENQERTALESGGFPSFAYYESFGVLTESPSGYTFTMEGIVDYEKAYVFSQEGFADQEVYLIDESQNGYVETLCNKKAGHYTLPSGNELKTCTGSATECHIVYVEGEAVGIYYCN